MASESAKVGYLLWYQAACRKAPAPCAIRSCANRVTSENSPNRAGVVLRIAISDHCLCDSNPRCLRICWKVTSSCQRITNQQSILCGSALRSVHRSAWVLNSPCGSRTTTQRIGTAGNPVLYQTAVAQATSTVRFPPPYQSSTVVGVQVVEGSSATTERFGRRSRPSGAVGLSDQLCVVGHDRRARRRPGA